MVNPTAIYYASILDMHQSQQCNQSEPTHQAGVQVPPPLNRRITLHRRLDRRPSSSTSSPSHERSLASGLFAGAAFGAVSTAVGYPFDMIKTKMQTSTTPNSLRETMREVYRIEGIRGYYRGVFSPLIGTTLSRSILFNVSSHTKEYCLQQECLAREIPNSGGLRPAIIISAIVFGSTRTVVEASFELIKVQAAARICFSTKNVASNEPATNPNGKAAQQLRALYRGFVPSLLRSVVGLGSFYVTADYMDRHAPGVVYTPWIGPFLRGAVSGVVAATVSYPLDSVKSLVRADREGRDPSRRFVTLSTLRRLYCDRGIMSGLYRGYCAGAARAFVANGFAMLAYSLVDDLQRHRE